MKNKHLLTAGNAPPESTISLIQQNTNQINIKRLNYFFFWMLIIEPFIILFLILKVSYNKTHTKNGSISVISFSI